MLVLHTGAKASIAQWIDFEAYELVGMESPATSTSVPLNHEPSDHSLFEGECEEMMQHLRDVVGGTAGLSMLTQPKKATAPSATDSHELSHKQAARIAVKTKRGTLFIGSADVLAVVAQGNYVLLVCESGSHHLRESISMMEEKLKAYGFVRIHRSVLVNKVWVDEIRPYAPTKYLLRLKNDKEFIVTRTYKGNLKSLAELWLGNDTFHGG